MTSATPTNDQEEPGTPATAPDLPHRLLTIAEAAEYLNVPSTWLTVRVTKRAVPHTRIGKHVRFTTEHLARIIADGESGSPADEVPAPAVSPRLTRRRT